MMVDVEGYFPVDSGYRPLAQAVVLDTAASGQRFAAISRRSLRLTGTAGVPSVDVSAVALTVRGSGAAYPGYVTVWDCSEPRPNASNVNLTGASSTTNLVLAKLAPSGDACLFSQAPADLSVAVVGFFGPLVGT